MHIFFFFNDTATTEIYTLSLHDALPICTNGFLISHSFHTIDGFTVKRAFQGLKLGPHDTGDGPVVGLLVQNNLVNAHSRTPITGTYRIHTSTSYNKVKGNRANGISYSND